MTSDSSGPAPSPDSGAGGGVERLESGLSWATGAPDRGLRGRVVHTRAIRVDPGCLYFRRLPGGGTGQANIFLSRLWLLWLSAGTSLPRELLARGDSSVEPAEQWGSDLPGPVEHAGALSRIALFRV